MTEYEITTHPDGKQFIRIEDKWMPIAEVVRHHVAWEALSALSPQWGVILPKEVEVIRGAYMDSNS